MKTRWEDKMGRRDGKLREDSCKAVIRRKEVGVEGVGREGAQGDAAQARRSDLITTHKHLPYPYLRGNILQSREGADDKKHQEAGRQ